MKEQTFNIALLGIAVTFFLIFAALVVPALANDQDLVGAFAAGFVNPYASGYSIDVVLCWVTLMVWVVYDAREFSIRHGWLCLVLGIIPGVAVGFPLYLLLRNRQLKHAADP